MVVMVDDFDSGFMDVFVFVFVFFSMLCCGCQSRVVVVVVVVAMADGRGGCGRCFECFFFGSGVHYFIV